jgi:ribosomal protein L11 methyltransferase
LPEGQSRAIAHFQEHADALQAAEELHTEPPFEIPAQDWSVAWRVHHKRIELGEGLSVGPPWEKGSVVIEPGMAFGTGSHATTLLCLLRLRELPVKGASVLDIGTGSGIIALLAHVLGAGRICATENDPVALESARRNAALNGVSRIEWLLEEDPARIGGRFGIVVANILLNTLEELSPEIARKVAPGGRLVLSGLLADQADAAERAYVAQGLKPVLRRQREEWMLVELEQP